MLLAKDPGRAKVPIWFTEIGREAKGEEDSQGSALVKAFVMGIAQGVTRINWFEGKDGDSGPMGLLRADGTPRLAFTAMSTMTRLLGPAPQYVGWVSVNGKHNGFVFQGATSTVMAMWARPNAVDRVEFGSVVEFVDPRTGGASKADRCLLSGFPVFMSGVPEVLVRRAQANKALPFPWDGDFSRAKGVSLTARKPNLELGLHQLQADASSAVVNVEGSEVRDCSQSAAQSFVVDPNFLSYTTRPITITALVRRKEGNENAGFNLTYESKTGWKNADGWYAVPENPNWHSKTWIIHDSQFVGKWGINFSFNSDSPMHSKYYLKSVVVANEEGAGGR
jgi:polysaccharide biosynthesis protein PslG